ncbi:MAG: class I SAM-dependent methyltransferase [Pyrinomonadaceae bacterium]|nr:class I SAM-dependent methyltransferase [Pyrinomonadaceae bacterium]
MDNFEQLIENLDLKLFEKINSQSTDDDKQSLLACQLTSRELKPDYNYLEIGSYLGGSIQPHLLDKKCARIYSIDKRPLHQPDERGVDYTYLNNSTERMMQLLSEVAPQEIGKITTINGDTRQINSSEIEDKISLCFIDGEHTDAAVLSDFRFCLNVLAENGAIIFHDASITYNGISNCIRHLQDNSIKFRAYNLPDILFVIEIGDFPLHQNKAILERLTNNYQSYIYSLQSNDYYRQFANKKPFRLYRKLMTKWKGLNKFE